MNRLSRRTRREVRTAIREMGRVEGLEAVILFGSVARGTATPHSDCDIAVVGTQEAVDTVGDAVAGKVTGVGPVQVVALARDAGEMNDWQWGSFGCDVVVTGMALRGQSLLARWRARATPPMTEDGVVALHGRTLRFAEAAAREWAGYRHRDRDDVRLEMAAGDSARAGKQVGVAACRYRGFGYRSAGWLRGIAEDTQRAGRDGPAVLDKDVEAGAPAGYLSELLPALNGHAAYDLDTDAWLARRERPDRDALEARAGYRLGALLGAAMEDHRRLVKEGGFSRLEERLAGDMEDMDEEVVKLVGDPCEDVAAGAQAWMERNHE